MGEEMMAEEDASASSDSSLKEEAEEAEEATVTTPNRTPLSALSDAFEELAREVEEQQQSGASNGELRLSSFCEACTLVPVLFNSLGIAFRFAESEYVSKVNELSEASKTFDTLGSILDNDIESDSVKKPRSLSRHLRRVRQGLDLIKALFEQFISSSELPLRDAASIAYAQTCAPYHTWAIRKAVGAGMYALPSREQLILRLNEDDQSIEKEMRRYISASCPVINYVDSLFSSRDIALDW